jgi:hypothetical protein
MKMFRWSVISAIVALVIAIVSPGLSFAQEARSFSDVPPNHAAYQAVEYLKERGVISGYPDGTFQPDKKVNRAEAAKIIVAPLLSAEELGQFTTTVFADVPEGVWYLPYVESARQRFGIIDGPPKKTSFYGEKPVLKVEFLKMLELAHGVDPNAYGEIRLPLSSDVRNPDEWFYPYLRYALAASMTMVGTDGLLNPGSELTRGQVALLLHRLLMYKEGRRTQALLSETETEILNVLQGLDAQDVEQAEFASARALLAARGAHASRPDESLVKSALKTAEGFRALVQAYRAGLNGEYAEVVRLSGEGWNLAASVREFSPALSSVADQMQGIAKSMADEARKLMGGESE